MRNGQLWLWAALMLLVGLIGASVWVYHSKKDPATPPRDKAASSAQEVNTAFVEVPVLTDSETHDSLPAAHLTYSMHYPTVAFAAHPDLAKEANDVIGGFVHNTIDDFTKSVADASSPDIPKDATSDLTVRFSTLLTSPTIISVRFDSSEYIAGSAHPNNQVRVLNYDLAKHLLLSPMDLFASSTAALPFLSTYTRDALRQKFADLSDQEFAQEVIPGTEPAHENFQNVGITKDGLLVIFDPYQVASYARGIPEVAIPYEKLDSVISADVREAIHLASTNIVEATPVSEQAE